MAEEIIALILLASSFFVAIAVIHHYVKSFIIPAVAVMMALGAISVFLPTPEGFEFEDLYHFVETEMSEVILLVIIPILIFESGRKVKIGDLKHEAVHIGFFAIVGVIITIFLIGFSIGVVFEIPLIHALLFGAILAATDPVAVGAVFSKFPIPHRLNTLIEGESLFNDATGVISFNVIKSIIFAGVVFSLLDATLSFLWSMIGAIVLGSAIGWISGKVLNRWNDDEHVDFTFGNSSGNRGICCGRALFPCLRSCDYFVYCTFNFKDPQGDRKGGQDSISQILGLSRICCK